MNAANPKDPIDRLVAAYERMLERVHESADVAEQKTLPWLRETLAEARERAVELGELSREEAERVATYVERDIHDAASFIVESGRAIHDWWDLDVAYLRDSVMSAFASMADHTSEALREIAERARAASEYHTGEITAPGVLECASCGELLHFKQTGHIPPCPKCQHTVFKRRSHSE